MSNTTGDKMRSEFETYYLNANYPYSEREMQKAWEAWQHQQSLIDAKDAALKNRFCAGCNAVLSPTTMTQQYVDIIAVKDAEIVELRNLHKQTFMAGHEKIQTLTKERDDALARIEVQRVNIEALQTNRAQSRNDEGGV